MSQRPPDAKDLLSGIDVFLNPELTVPSDLHEVLDSLPNGSLPDMSAGVREVGGVEQFDVRMPHMPSTVRPFGVETFEVLKKPPQIGASPYACRPERPLAALGGALI